MRRSLLLLSLAMIGGCLQTAVTRETLRPIPEHAARVDKPASVRGTPQGAAQLSAQDQVDIVSTVIRVFYRPLMTQARWIDPRPLAHERTVLADSSVAPDPNRAIAIAQATGLRRVCPLEEANVQCQGRDGGILRASAAYAVGPATGDSALVYLRYSPRNYGVASEMEFFMAREDSVWYIVSRRSLPLDMPQGHAASEVVDTEQAAQDLIAADRRFAAAGANIGLVTALSNMFVPNVVMQTPAGHVRGRDAAVASLQANPLNIESRATWTPIGGGTSSNGRDGFTYGYITVTQPNGTVVPGKYVAYWVRTAAGWRVAVYRRVPRPAGQASSVLLPLSIATRALPNGDSATVQRFADELSLAEHSFSREAQEIGLGPAFAKWGAPDAVNVGGPGNLEFVRGPQAIAQSVSAGLTPGTKVEWGPTQVIVAATGDLGVSIGTIRITTTETREVPFFTIWKRAWPSDPWRYVAE